MLYKREYIENNKKLKEENKQLKDTIKKAIEYIEPLVELDNDIMLKGTMLKPVLKILKGEDKE